LDHVLLRRPAPNGFNLAEHTEEDIMAQDGADVERRADVESGLDGKGQRSQGVAIDLEKLEQQAKSLYLHRFVESIQKARSDYGRYLILRAGDEIAIRAAGDGSDDLLEDVAVEINEEG
jgi:hypothetical protein